MDAETDIESALRKTEWSPTKQRIVGSIFLLVVTGIAAFGIWTLKTTVIEHMFPSRLVDGTVEKCELSSFGRGSGRHSEYDLALAVGADTLKLSGSLSASNGLKRLKAGDEVVVTATPSEGYVCAVERNGEVLLSVAEYRWRYFLDLTHLATLVVTLLCIGVPTLLWFFFIRGIIYEAPGWEIPGSDDKEAERKIREWIEEKKRSPY